MKQTNEKTISKMTEKWNNNAWGSSEKPNKVESILIGFVREVMFGYPRYLEIMSWANLKPSLNDYLTNGTNVARVRKCSAQLQQEKEKACFEELHHFYDFVQEGKNINLDDFESEFALFMSRNYAEREFEYISQTKGGKE